MKLKLLLIGSNGFIGKNIILSWQNHFEIIVAKIDWEYYTLLEISKNCDIIINAAGVSRSPNEEDFFKYNFYHSQKLYDVLNTFKNKTIIYFSSIHYNSNTLYGISKRYNEYILSQEYSKNNRVFCYRLPGVFGPNSKPNYVSVVSTFCFNIINNIESKIVEGEKILDLIFIDDLLNEIKEDLSIDFKCCYMLKEDFLTTCKISVIDLYNTINNLNQMDEKMQKKKDKDLNINLLKTLNSFK